METLPVLYRPVGCTFETNILLKITQTTKQSVRNLWQLRAESLHFFLNIFHFLYVPFLSSKLSAQLVDQKLLKCILTRDEISVGHNIIIIIYFLKHNKREL